MFHFLKNGKTVLSKTLFIRAFLMLALIAPANLSHAEQMDKLPDNSKLVVIGGALTEIVYALDSQDRIVGRDMTSLYPVEAQKINDVGYMRALSPEGVLSLKPEAILLIEGSGPPTTLDVLKKASVPMVIIPEKNSRDGVLEKIRLIGDVLNKKQEAQSLIDSVSHQFDEVNERTRNITTKKRILFIMTMQNGRIMAAGQNTAADSMIKLAGATNAINGFSGYKTLNDEALISAAPDVILMMKNGGQPVSIDDVFANPAIKLTNAGKNKTLIQMDGLYLLGFGPRTAQAANELSEQLYGKTEEAALKKQ